MLYSQITQKVIECINNYFVCKQKLIIAYIAKIIFKYVSALYLYD